MVYSFIPEGNASDICAGLTTFNENRPPTPGYYPKIGISLITFFAFVNLGSIPIAYYYRREPRFRKIRPWYFTALSLIFFFTYMLAALLPSVGKYGTENEIIDFVRLFD